MRNLLVTLMCAIVSLTACSGGPAPGPEDEGPLVGAKIYDFEGEAGALFTRWAGLGLNTAFASEQLARRRDFREAAERTGTDVFVIFPVFFAPEALADDSDLFAVTATGDKAREDWVEFACPSREEFRGRKIAEAVATVEETRPDGLSIDFIRYFVFWEMVEPDHAPDALPDTCYCTACLTRFAETVETAADVPVEDPVAAAAWIHDNAADEWTRFKCATITSMVEEMATAVRRVQPEIRVNLHAVPWRAADFHGGARLVAGQDSRALGKIVDFLSPMCYTFMQHRPPEWVASVVEDMDRHAACPVLPSIQVARAYRDQSFAGREFEAALRAALEPPSAGVVFWSWKAIAADPEKEAVIRRVLQEQQVSGGPDTRE